MRRKLKGTYPLEQPLFGPDRIALLQALYRLNKQRLQLIEIIHASCLYFSAFSAFCKKFPGHLGLIRHAVL